MAKWQTLTLFSRVRGLWGSTGTLRNRLARATVGSALLALSSKVLMLMTSVVLARWMGAEGYGVYATAIALIFLLTVPTGLGLPTLVIRLLASYRVHRQWELMRGLLVLGNQAVLVTSVAMAGFAAVAIWASADLFGADRVMTYGLATLLIPLISLGAMRSAALRGLHHVILGQLPENLIMPGLFLMLTVGWWIAQGEAAPLQPEWAILTRVMATAMAFSIGTLMLFRRIPIAVRQVTARYELRTWTRSALPLLFIAGINIVNTQTDILMLAALRGSESAGVYQAAVRGAELVAFSLVIVNMAIQPSIARLYAAGDKGRLQRLATLSARAATVVALPLAAVMIVWGNPIITMVFGADFTRGANAMAVLSIAQLANAFTGPANSLLNMTGHEKDQLKAMTFGVFINIFLNLLLIPKWEILGASISTAISLVAWNFITVAFVWNRIKVNPTAVKNG